MEWRTILNDLQMTRNLSWGGKLIRNTFSLLMQFERHLIQERTSKLENAMLKKFMLTLKIP
jgi:hypothetical protein